MKSLDHFLSGAIFMGFTVAGLFFLKFWRRTHDTLFRSLALAVWIFAIVRAVSYQLPNYEYVPYLYFTKLLAYGLILWSIIQKNRRTDCMMK